MEYSQMTKKQKRKHDNRLKHDELIKKINRRNAKSGKMNNRNSIPSLSDSYKFKFGKWKGFQAYEVPESYRNWFREMIPKSQW